MPLLLRLATLPFLPLIWGFHFFWTALLVAVDVWVAIASVCIRVASLALTVYVELRSESMSRMQVYVTLSTFNGHS